MPGAGQAQSHGLTFTPGGDQVHLDRQVHTAAGVLLTSGSFLACEPLGIKDGKLAYHRDGQRAWRTAADVARLVYKPVPAELVETLPPDRTGTSLWPGSGATRRGLGWTIDRCTRTLPAAETPNGFVPRAGDLNLQGLTIAAATIGQLLDVDRSAWHAEIDDVGRYLDEFGGRLPSELRNQYRLVKRALG